MSEKPAAGQYEDGGYVLPYGFVQSPILATLVLALSPIGDFLRNLDPAITASVYMDDLCLSSSDLDELTASFEGLRVAVVEAGFTLNEGKTRQPALLIDIFNCELEHERSEVLTSRRDEFYAVEHSPQSVSSFERYCAVVESDDWRNAPGIDS